MENTEKNYWNENGKFQKELDIMYDLVPSSGEVKIKENSKLETAIENVRQMTRLYYDFYNNGCCNVIDVERDICNSCDGGGYQRDDDDEDDEENSCYECDGECYVDGEVKITSFYSEMVDNLEFFTDIKIEEVLKNCGSNYGQYSFPIADCNSLEVFADKVIELSWGIYMKTVS